MHIVFKGVSLWVVGEFLPPERDTGYAGAYDLGKVFVGGKEDITPLLSDKTISEIEWHCFEKVMQTEYEG